MLAASAGELFAHHASFLRKSSAASADIYPSSSQERRRLVVSSKMSYMVCTLLDGSCFWMNTKIPVIAVMMASTPRAMSHHDWNSIATSTEWHAEGISEYEWRNSQRSRRVGKGARSSRLYIYTFFLSSTSWAACTSRVAGSPAEEFSLKPCAS